MVALVRRVFSRTKCALETINIRGEMGPKIL